jgi:GNAT superfamily N-acetyltransferase
MTIRLLDRDSERDVTAWHAMWQAVGAHDLPADVPLGRTELTWWLQDSATHRVETLVVPDVDGFAGSVLMALPGGENAHMSWSELFVRPNARRRGVGRELFRHAVDRLRADGRRTVNFSAPDSAGAQAFATTLGATETQRKVRYVYRFERVDGATRDAIAATAAAASPGYSLLRWVGPCPDEHLAAFARAEAGMTDSPIIDAVDFHPTTPAAAEIRDTAERAAGLGIREYVICARADGTGEFAGMTRVYVFGGGRAEQDDTTVLGTHRGHRLGLRMKAEMIRWLADAERDLAQIETWNDATNTPMIRVNVALGCTAADVWPTWTAGVR